MQNPKRNLLVMTCGFFWLTVEATLKTSNFVRFKSPKFSIEGSTVYNYPSRMRCVAACNQAPGSCDVIRYNAANKECQFLVISTGKSDNLPTGMVTHSDNETFYVREDIQSSIQVCPTGWAWLGYKCYKFGMFGSSTQMTRENAVAICSSFNSILMKVENVFQLNFLLKQFVALQGENPPKRTWVSGRRRHSGSTDMDFVFDDGTAIPNNDDLWIAGEPNNRYPDEDFIKLLYFHPRIGLGDANIRYNSGFYICEMVV